MSRTYLRGEIYYADLDPVVGSEQMGTFCKDGYRCTNHQPHPYKIKDTHTQLHRHDRQYEISLGGHAGAAAHPG